MTLVVDRRIFFPIKAHENARHALISLRYSRWPRAFPCRAQPRLPAASRLSHTHREEAKSDTRASCAGVEHGTRDDRSSDVLSVWRMRVSETDRLRRSEFTVRRIEAGAF